jgi:hypothetical protein
VSEYAAAIASLKAEEDKQKQVVSSLSEAATTNPDEFANMVKLSRAAKISLDAVPTYKEEAQQAKFLGDVGLERLWKDAPKTTQFLATPEHSKMASDDIENLSGIEGALNWTANRARAIAQFFPKANAGVWGAAAAPFELLGVDSVGGYMRDMQHQAGAQAKRWGPQDKPGWMGNAIDQGLTSFGQNAASLALAFMPGGQGAALASMVIPVFGESYGKGRDAGLSPAQSIQFGTQDAAAEYVFERFGLGNLVKNVKSGTGLGKTMVQFMMREVPSEMATTVVQSFDEYANINPNKPVGEWLSQLPDELAQTVVATLVGGSAISASAKAVQKTMQIASYRQQEAQDAESGAGFIETLNKFIGASTTLQRDPETFERFIEQATENGPVENIYINAQTLQQSGIAEQLAAVSPAIAEQFQTAIETGGDIRIPVAEYASKIAPTEFAQSLVDYLKVDENGFSRAEAQEYMQSQGEELQAHIERVMAENEGDTTFKASVETVKETIRSQLDTANRFTSQNNEAFSTLTATFFAVTAARLGMTPEALYAKYPLRVVAESIAGGQKFDQGRTLQQLRDDLQKQQAGFDAYDAEIRGGVDPDGDKYFGLADKVTEAMDAFVADLEQIPDDSFSLQAKTKDGRMLLVNPSAQKPGHYQLTRFASDGNPWGDTQYPTKKQAIKDFLDESDASTVKDFGGQLNQGENIWRTLADAEDLGGKGAVIREAMSIIKTNPELAGAVLMEAKNLGYDIAADSGLDLALIKRSGGAGVDLNVAPSSFNEDEGAGIKSVTGNGADAGKINVDGVERPIRNNQGRLIATTKEGLRNFWRWFGESEVVDDKGLPMVVYHATDDDIKEFSLNKLGSNTDNNTGGDQAAIATAMAGFWFSSKPLDEEMGTTAVMPVYLRIENSAPVDHRRFWDDATVAGGDSLREQYENDGYDGLIMKDIEFKGTTSYVAFEPTQIKSATGNRGTFDPNDANILNQSARLNTDTPEFRNWFGDSAVVDSDGKPLRVFHGTASDITAFDIGRSGESTGNTGFYGAGAYFSEDADYASGFSFWARRSDDQAPNVVPVYLSLKNPAYINITPRSQAASEKSRATAEKIISTMIARGTDQAVVDKLQGFVSENKFEPFMGTLYNALGGGTGTTALLKEAGFDGVTIYGGISGKEKLAEAVAFDPTQIKSAIGNRGTFDPNDANILNQQARASFNPATLQMSLLKNADLSSFLHESGHFFLEVQFDIAAQLQQEAAIHGADTLKEGEQEYLRDSQAVLDWFGIKDIAEWNNLDFEEKRSYHERYAESFEAYLFSGKAPSIELAPLFQKFRAFLTSVYTSLKNFLAGHPEAGKLNEEVIAVFDRMLATNEQILLAEQARSMMPLFDANDGTITPEEYASLQALGIAGTNEAIQELQAKGLRDLQWARNAKSRELRRLQRESKGIREELTMQARREIMSQPVYQVWSFLTKKQTRDDMTDLEQTRADYREILKVWNDGRKDEEEKQRAAAKQEVWESSEEGQKKYRKDGAMLKAQQKVLRREDRLIDDLTAKAIGEWEQKNPKPRDPEARAKSDPDNVDESQDSLFAAIAKLGGINKRELVETWGIDPADKAASGVFGKYVMRADDKGLSIDGMVEALSQYGYLTLDEHGKADMRELEDKFKSELGGDTKYSNAYDYSADLQASPIINPAALSAGRLDMAGLSEIGLPPEIINHLKALRMTAKDGLHPDMVAEVVGNFGSGDEMVRAIVSAKPPKEAIADRAQELMEQNHGELANDEAIDREADKAIHNEVRARAVEAELNALAKATNQREPTGNLDKNGKPITRPVLATAAREFAAQMIGRLKVRDIKPSQYANSEAKAARAADKAKKAGDVAQAMAEKRNQLINLYLTKSAYAGQDEAGDIVRYLSKFDREGTRKALANDYLVQIDAILERFDLRKGQSLKAIDKRDSLAKFIESQAEAGIEPEIPEWLVLESNKMHYKNLTLDELRAVNESVRQIEHLGRLKNKLLTAKDARELNEIVQEISASMIANAPGLVDNEARNEIGSKISQMWRGAMAAHRKAASVVRQMDGFKDGGPMWEYFIRSMNEAGEREASMRADAAEKLHALAKPVMEAGKLGGKGKFFPALNRNLNRGEIIAMALNIGNESNLQRLLGGKNWTVGQIKPALDTLSATDWAFVQGVWDFFESYRPEIGAKQMRVYGTEPDWIKPGNPFLQMLSAEKGLSLRGGYYPVKYDPRQSGKSAEFDEKQAAQDMMRAANTAATTRRSFTKARVEEVKGRPLLLSFDGIWQGANEVIHDLTWHEWLIDANRLMKRLDEPMRDHYGAEYVNVLRASIKDSAQGDMPATNHIQRGLNHLRIGATVAGLGWNLTTSLLQPIGLTQSVVRIGAPWVARGLKSFYNSPIAKAEEVQAKSEFMRNRGRTFMREINDVRNRLESDKGEVRSMVESSFFVLIQKMQATVDYPTWLGAYEKAISAGNDEARSIGLADQAVIDSQGGGQIKDLAEVQRGHPVFKLFTNFYSFFNVALNLTVERTKGTNFHKPAEVAALAGDYVLLLILPSAIGAVLKSVLKGGDDDEEKLLKKIAEEQIGFLLGLFVGLREITSGVQMALGVGNPGIGYSGPAGARFFAEMQKLGQQIGQGEADMALFKAANSTGGILFHYPAGQVNRAVEGTAALLEGRTNNPLAPLVGPPPKN